MSNERRLLYHIWKAMIRRCYNQKDHAYHNYGGRGISVCQRWRESFVDFLSDVSPRPSGMLLDRRDNNGDYSPNNFRWSTRKEQNSNRRNCILVEVCGEQVTLAEASRRAGINKRVVHARVHDYHWTTDMALSVPVGSVVGNRTGRNQCHPVMVIVAGAEITLTDACTLYGVPRHTAYMRLRRGWSHNKALGVIL
jgi:hypothetical protein